MAEALPTLAEAARDLAMGRTTARQLTETALAAIEAPDGEGARTFTKVYRDQALAAAEASDALRRQGLVLSPLAGLPISIKDLFDVAGEPTTAGSRVLAQAPAAQADAPVVARLRAAGAILTGRTNMTEFAFSGLGINPHYGTPGNPADRARIPGGSSSGAAVSVTDGMSLAAIGSDTGGSVRIPSAFCGLTGFKPSQRRVPLDGAYPLSTSFDSIGPLAASVACCALLDAVLAGEAPRALSPRPVKGLRLALPQALVLDGLDPAVARAFEVMTSALSRAGAILDEVPAEAFGAVPEMNASGGLIVAEAWAQHRALIAEQGDGYDQLVRKRMTRGREIEAADYIQTLKTRRRLVAMTEAELAPFDAYLLPSVAILPPRIEDLREDEAAIATNALILRNTAMGNVMDLCAISLPCHAPGSLPVGLMLMARNGQDHALLDIAAGIEPLVADARRTL